MKLTDALALYSNHALEQIALQQGLFEIADRGLRGSGRIRAAQALSKKMSEPDQVARNVRQIGPVGRAALKILLDGGPLGIDRLRQTLTRAGITLRAPNPDAGGKVISTPQISSAHPFWRMRWRGAPCLASFWRWTRPTRPTKGWKKALARGFWWRMKLPARCGIISCWTRRMTR